MKLQGGMALFLSVHIITSFAIVGIFNAMLTYSEGNIGPYFNTDYQTTYLNNSLNAHGITSPNVRPNVARQHFYISNIKEEAVYTITCNENFSDYNFVGSGTKNDPYIITNNFSNVEIAIYITNVSKYFTISGCSFQNVSTAIYIYAVSTPYFTIEENYFEDIKAISIIIENSSFFVTQKNNFNSVFAALLLNHSLEGEISDNTILSSTYFGLWVNNSNSITIAENFLYSSGSGIVLTNSSELSLNNNSVTQCNYYGLYCYNCSNVSLDSTLIYDNSLDTPYYSDLACYFSKNITITNLYTNETSYGMYIHDSESITIQGLNMSYHQQAIEISNSLDLTFLNVDFMSNGYDFKISNTENVLVQHLSSIIKDMESYQRSLNIKDSENIQLLDLNIHGISESGAIIDVSNEICSVSSSSNFIMANSVLYGSALAVVDSRNVSFTNNTIHGISTLSVLFSNSEDIRVVNNTITEVTIGINLYQCKNAKITYNILKDNRLPAIMLEETNDTVIHHNDFVNCNYDQFELNGLTITSQAYDNAGNNNTWYDVKDQLGNFWSDWNGKGPYKISGSTGAVDLYPSEVGINGSWTLKKKATLSLWIFIATVVFVIIPIKKWLRKK